MAIQLQSISFNHDPASATADALTIRRNAAEAVTVPEWRQGFCVAPEDSPAAYSIADTAGHTVTVKATFATSNANELTAEIRAVDPAYPRLQGCVYQILQKLGIIPIVPPPLGNVLGEAKARMVSFDPVTLRSGAQSFELEFARLQSAGVGAETTTWQWEYRVNTNDPWTPIATTRHLIYTVLQTPTAPWQQTPAGPANTQLPWTDALDYACRWAAGAHSRDDAAGRITRAIYQLGPAVVEYDCPGGGSSHYAMGPFDLTAFVERLRGGVGNGQWVNCTDCATFVSTFANLLGCDLWQSRMGWSFGLNPLLGIGSSVWQPACGWSGFSYHEVAWKGSCLASDEIFDACLQVDGDADPTAAPHTALLPVTLRFGNPGDGFYRDRLATPATRPQCAPQPATRTRRVLV